MNLEKTTFLIALAAAIAAGAPTRAVATPKGVGTWDGRSGSDSIGSNSLFNPKMSGRENQTFVEVHIMWIWKPCFFIDFDSPKHKTIENGMVVLAQPIWDENDSFWNELWRLKKDKDSDTGWRMIVDALRTQNVNAGLWNIRAYEDIDDHGKQYKALEVSACLHFLPDVTRSEKQRKRIIEKLNGYIRDKTTITEDESTLRRELEDMKIAEITQLEAWLFSKK